MKRASRWALLLELGLLAANLGTAGPIADGVRAIGLIVVAIVGGLAVFVAVVWAIGILGQREPPYPV